MQIDAVPTPPPDPPPPAPPRPSRPLTAIVDDVRRTGAALAAAEVARTRALAEAGHLALDVMAGQRATARAAELALREVASELAAAENLSDRTVQTQIGRAMTLVDDYPRTLAAWEAGVLTRTHVQTILDVGAALPVDARAEFDLLAVATADGLSPGRLRARLTMLAERLHPTTVTERHQRGRDTRCVRVITGDDGMSDLIATLPTVLAVGIHDRLTHQARVIIDSRGDDADTVPDERTTAQLRADLLADLLLTAAPDGDPTRTDDAPGLLGAIRARIQVVVPALTMLDPDRENLDPVELVGHGPIDAGTARILADTTTLPWDRIITHPLTGAVLHTDTYHRTTAIDRHLRARDRHCRWPGCTTPAIRCEVDHTHDHALGGTTAVANLAHLCQRHHTQKQFTRWLVTQHPGGVLHWTSPTGRTYTDEPLPYSPAVRFLPDDPPPPEPDQPPAPF
ncbi:HNH endonuclease signature motif containing protein [Microbacterium sp. lyk4-40-TSB-66]|uniref:HNH endonuclease signature motif containing protein n=1 Tax=Microbacterium sp. lyk4-40-TSB-66 TaxID=3040294 RepID=UPI00254F4596|nr:HNH endonuclease signature motif containing protein [Microbacterium sp. lyk4-40-TSB-66]